MICFFCHKPITGAEAKRRLEWRTGPVTRDVRVYGDGAPNGKLGDATGRLLKAAHHKCFHASKKQEELAAAKAADPEAQLDRETDWRHQETVDVEDLAGEGHRDCRGAGAEDS